MKCTHCGDEVSRYSLTDCCGSRDCLEVHRLNSEALREHDDAGRLAIFDRIAAARARIEARVGPKHRAVIDRAVAKIKAEAPRLQHAFARSAEFDPNNPEG